MEKWGNSSKGRLRTWAYIPTSLVIITLLELPVFTFSSWISQYSSIFSMNPVVHVQQLELLPGLCTRQVQLHLQLHFSGNQPRGNTRKHMYLWTWTGKTILSEYQPMPIWRHHKSFVPLKRSKSISTGVKTDSFKCFLSHFCTSLQIWSLPSYALKKNTHGNS